METLLRIGLSNAVAAALLALVVGTAACVWRRPAVLHALWLLVLVKLLTPPLVWLPEPWSTPASPPPKVVAETPLVPAAADPPEVAVRLTDPPADGPAFDPILVSSPEPEPDPVAVAPPVTPPTPTPTSARLAPVACGVWLAGTAAWYALAVCRLRHFRRLLGTPRRRRRCYSNGRNGWRKRWGCGAARRCG